MVSFSLAIIASSAPAGHKEPVARRLRLGLISIQPEDFGSSLQGELLLAMLIFIFTDGPHESMGRIGNSHSIFAFRKIRSSKFKLR
ncbi:MAG: hypothetical protein ACFBRM_02270 [Pikeienuella sp.]